MFVVVVVVVVVAAVVAAVVAVSLWGCFFFLLLFDRVLFLSVGRCGPVALLDPGTSRSTRVWMAPKWFGFVEHVATPVDTTFSSHRKTQ